ncbi:hypothetical protein SS50377_22898 [Spironucleus salmonicida]|uniref:Uncharacterized protein n=1 Tax=Spironucleus salmonicida TaxID=348837 RepID=V6LVU2_9EUKA|nr:hypothetical protein SS50377_22898 [Spironucleus salmonicida]|eukprot:EST48747.1 Hypothetical protein SS50377_11068 [Spironucleus salmonicida]
MKGRPLRPLGSKLTSSCSLKSEAQANEKYSSISDAISDMDLIDLSNLSKCIQSLSLQEQSDQVNTPRQIVATSRLATIVRRAEDGDESSNSKEDVFQVCAQRPTPVPLTSRKIIQQRNSYDEDQTSVFELVQQLQRNSIIRKQRD